MKCLHNLDIQTERNSIFFILNNNEMVNMGIVLDSKTFITVLDTDKRVVTHTENDIKKAYPNYEIKIVDNCY